MIALDQINKIVADCSKMGHDVKVRDISYILLMQFYSDSSTAYKTLFDKDANKNTVDNYDRSRAIKFLKTYIESNFLNEKEDKGKKASVVTPEKMDSISFEENRRGMEDDIRAIEEMLGSNILDSKEIASLIKTKADLRVKLNDKFGASDKTEQQTVVVQMKYSSVCERCHTELFIPTRAQLINEYNLMQDPNKPVVPEHVDE